METTSFMRLFHYAPMPCFYVYIFNKKMSNLLFSLCCSFHTEFSRARCLYPCSDVATTLILWPSVNLVVLGELSPTFTS